MTGGELVDKLKRTPFYVEDIVQATGVTPAEVVAAAAKNAFLLNLFAHLGIDPDGGPDVGSRGEGAGGLLEHLMGLLQAFERTVPERLVKRAHCDMVLPMTRSIISSCLYGEGVSCTPLGVPKKYGAA